MNNQGKQRKPIGTTITLRRFPVKASKVLMLATSSSSRAKVKAWAGRKVVHPIIKPHVAIYSSFSLPSPHALHNKPLFSCKVGELMPVFPTLGSTGRLYLRNSELHSILVPSIVNARGISVSRSLPSNSRMFLRYLLFALFFHLR